MKVVVADRAGVCFGVKRALELVAAESGGGEPIATLGPLIHNPQVVDRLTEQGVRVVGSVEEAEAGGIVMPSHGVPSSVKDAAEAAGLRVIDATCPFVANVHQKVDALSSEGYTVVILGDPDHSEVKAIRSAAGDGAVVISTPEQARQTNWSGKRVGVVCQTTQVPDRFAETVGAIAAGAKEVVAYNTICYATSERQAAARALAPEVEAMFVVGGRNSANTNRLTEICLEAGVPTFHVETAAEVRPEWVKGMQVVGVTAGASTPDWIIDEVRELLEQL